MNDKNYYLKIIGINISYYRKIRGLSQTQLAEKVGISRTHLSNIEAIGMPTSISLDLLFLIAEELDVPPSKLLESPF